MVVVRYLGLRVVDFPVVTRKPVFDLLFNFSPPSAALFIT
jgi:hypothetical protein